MACEVSPQVFTAISSLNMDEILKLDESQVRVLLPSFVRIALCRSLDNSSYWVREKKKILEVLSNYEASNLIVTLLSIDFHSLELEVKREQQLRAKLVLQDDSKCLKLSDFIPLEFEKSDGIKRLKLVLGELFAAQASIKQTMNPQNNMKSSNACYKISELLDNEMYIDDVCDTLCIAIAELPNTLSLVEVVETLLYFKEGHRLICRLVANFPESFHEVCLALLHNGEKQEDDSFIGKRRVEIICLLCKMNPSHALLIRSEALEAFRMPALSILLTLDSLSINETESDEHAIQKISDLVSFMSGIFFGNDEKLRSWFVQYVRNCQKKVDQGGKSSFMPLRNELLNAVKFVLKKNEQNDGNLTNYLVEASSILRLYSALKGIAGMKLSEEEASVIISLIICHPSSTPAGIKFASMGLCLLLACPSVIGNPESEKKTIDWLNWLVREESLFGQVSGVRSSFGEMLLLIAIHFHSNQISAISELVSTSLSLKINLRSNTLARLKTIFTQEVFTDRMITAHAVKVPVTSNLNSGIQGFLPVHCIYQLLRSRAFTRHKVPIKDWIYKQICSCTAPLNPVMPPLIEAYVNSVIIPSTKTTNVNTNEPMSEEEILAIFKHKIYSVNDQEADGDEDEDEDSDSKMEIDSEIHPSCMLTTQIILLYYILFYEDVRLNEMKNIVHQHNRTVKKYSSNLFSELPIFYLVQKAKNDPRNYGVIFPRLLRLVATHYPHLCLVQDWLAAEERDATVKVKMKRPISEIKDRLQKAFLVVHSNPKILVKTIDLALNLPNNYLWPLAFTFTDNLPKLLDERVPSEVLEKAKKLWWQLNCIFPDNLCVMTVNALSCKRSEEKVFTWEDIVLYPLHVLRCDERVFRCPELMEITLHVIQCFLMASRVYFAHHLREKPSKVGEEDREELRLALITAQESSVIQILLECCHSINEKEEAKESEKLLKIRKLIAVHLHQVFIADPNLAKIVHFQGYSNELLSFTVSSIPSMHICLDYIPELLSQPHMEEQIFAIQLCSYLVKQYPIVKSLCMAKLCFNVANTLLTVLESEKRQRFFTPVVPALVRMCEPFPPLRTEAINLLLKLGQISLSRLASTQSDFICTQKPLQKSANLEDISLEEAKSFLTSLPTVDPLCDIIRQSVQVFS